MNSLPSTQQSLCRMRVMSTICAMRSGHCVLPNGFATKENHVMYCRYLKFLHTIKISVFIVLSKKQVITASLIIARANLFSYVIYCSVDTHCWQFAPGDKIQNIRQPISTHLIIVLDRWNLLCLINETMVIIIILVFLRYPKYLPYVHDRFFF